MMSSKKEGALTEEELAQLKSLSRLLSLALRHEPGALGLKPDGAGWVQIDELLRRINTRAGSSDVQLRLKRMGRVSRAMLEVVVRTSDKQRFAFSEDGLRIRAVQGHSFDVDLGYPEARPPAVLYHGTSVDKWPAIDLEGLKPMSRQQVHLSSDVATATRVGQRHGRPLVLVVAAGDMHGQGWRFYQAPNGVWLVDEVPRRFVNQQKGRQPQMS
jgi:putative RNA 2'-phosphotransferase